MPTSTPMFAYLKAQLQRRQTRAEGARRRSCKADARRSDPADGLCSLMRLVCRAAVPGDCRLLPRRCGLLGSPRRPPDGRRPQPALSEPVRVNIDGFSRRAPAAISSSKTARTATPSCRSSSCRWRRTRGTRNSLDHRERVTTLTDEEFKTLYEYLRPTSAPPPRADAAQGAARDWTCRRVPASAGASRLPDVLFNSSSFLASFAAFTVLYYAVPHIGYRWPLLLAASLRFYARFGVRLRAADCSPSRSVAYAGGLAIDRDRGR